MIHAVEAIGGARWARRDPDCAAHFPLGAAALREEAEADGEGTAPRRQDQRHVALLARAFFDLIAGKPHLPSVPPLTAHPAQASVAASEPATAVTAAAAAADQPATAAEGHEPA